ncbi:hypothetical protein U27_02513 [Candidatus Vecturithrix granuli]|uniref:Uncharacterized protein n=1 Tax=Vecturithrix granuli TaxID=1499967 RepID=A0A0S6WAT7_VECG1|nr:hypothetical protein U27_02513 [Candidatus Vecturithrix granuli]
MMESTSEGGLHGELTALCRTVDLIPVTKTRFLQETWFLAVSIVMNNAVTALPPTSGDIPAQPWQPKNSPFPLDKNIIERIILLLTYSNPRLVVSLRGVFNEAISAGLLRKASQ